MLKTALVPLMALVLVAPSAAQAADVDRPDPATLRFQGTGDVRDVVRVSLVDGGTNVLFDLTATPGQDVTARSPCAEHGSSPPDVVCPRAGITRIELLLAAGDDNLNGLVVSDIPIRLDVDGGPGSDFLRGGALADLIRGGEDTDVLLGGAGADDFRGGPGFDEVRYCCDAGAVKVTIDDVADDGTGGTEGDNVRTDVERLLGGPGNDELTGSAAGNVLDGGDGEDLIIGLGGMDDLIGGAGADQLRARDAIADRVICGDGEDAAVTDDSDAVWDCEALDASGELTRDRDHDGVDAPADCDDRDAAVRPGAADPPDDGIDQDCSGADRTDADRDRDGSPRPGDCDDGNALAHPGAREVYGNAVDEDCSGRADPLQNFSVPVLASFTAGRRATAVRRFIVKDLPAGTRVELRCTGRRCPLELRTFSVTTANARLDLRKLAKLRRLRGSATLELSLLREDSIGRVLRYRVRNGRLPRLTVRCRAPGDAAPRRC